MSVKSQANKPSDKGGAQLDISGDQFAITLSDKAMSVVTAQAVAPQASERAQDIHANQDPVSQVIFGSGGPDYSIRFATDSTDSTDVNPFDQILFNPGTALGDKTIVDFTWKLVNTSDNTEFDLLFHGPFGPDWDFYFAHDALGAGSAGGQAADDVIQLIGTPSTGDNVVFDATLNFLS